MHGLTATDGRELYEAFRDTDRDPIRFLFERISSDDRWTAIDNIKESSSGPWRREPPRSPGRAGHGLP